jgi:hypothetical protein
LSPSPKSLIISPIRRLYSLKSKTFSTTASTISHCNPNGSGEKDKGAIPFRATNFPDTNIMNLSKESQEALEAMAKAEAGWDKLAKETTEVSGQFQKECQELKVELEELK